MSDNILKTKKEIEQMRNATRISRKIHKEIVSKVVKGATPVELDTLAAKLVRENGVKAAFNGVPGPIGAFPANICISVNEETLHTIPYSERAFDDGDLVKVDFGVISDGFYTDHCVTVGVGNLTKQEKKLIEIGKECIENGIKQAIVGNTIGDISYALESTCNKYGAHYVTNYAGHGIGKELWLDPQIPPFGKKGTLEKLEKGMVFCIENQITFGDARLELLDDGWTLVTVDNSKSVMFEHMVLITDGPAEVLTR